MDLYLDIFLASSWMFGQALNASLINEINFFVIIIIIIIIIITIIIVIIIFIIIIIIIIIRVPFINTMVLLPINLTKYE